MKQVWDKINAVFAITTGSRGTYIHIVYGVI